MRITRGLLQYAEMAHLVILQKIKSSIRRIIQGAKKWDHADKTKTNFYDQLFELPRHSCRGIE